MRDNINLTELINKFISDADLEDNIVLEKKEYLLKS